MILLGLAAPLVAMAVGARRLGGREPLVLILVLVFFATAVMFALPRSFGRGRAALAGLGAMAVLGAVLLVVVASDPARFNSLGMLFSLSVGASLCVAGVIEHRSLSRAMERLGAPGDD